MTLFHLGQLKSPRSFFLFPIINTVCFLYYSRQEHLPVCIQSPQVDASVILGEREVLLLQRDPIALSKAQSPQLRTLGDMGRSPLWLVRRPCCSSAAALPCFQDLIQDRPVTLLEIERDALEQDPVGL